MAGRCRVEERRAGREVEGARIPASSAIPQVPRTPLRLRFLSPLIEPSVRISRTGLSFEIMRSHTRNRAVRPVRRSRPLCGLPPGKRTSSQTPPRASDPATDAAAVPPAPVLPTAALRRPGTRFTSACICGVRSYVESDGEALAAQHVWRNSLHILSFPKVFFRAQQFKLTFAASEAASESRNLAGREPQPDASVRLINEIAKMTFGKLCNSSARGTRSK